MVRYRLYKLGGPGRVYVTIRAIMFIVAGDREQHLAGPLVWRADVSILDHSNYVGISFVAGTT